MRLPRTADALCRLPVELLLIIFEYSLAPMNTRKYYWGLYRAKPVYGLQRDAALVVSLGSLVCRSILNTSGSICTNVSHPHSAPVCFQELLVGHRLARDEALVHNSSRLQSVDVRISNEAQGLHDGRTWIESSFHNCTC